MLSNINSVSSEIEEENEEMDIEDRGLSGVKDRKALKEVSRYPVYFC